MTRRPPARARPGRRPDTTGRTCSGCSRSRPPKRSRRASTGAASARLPPARPTCCSERRCATTQPALPAPTTTTSGVIGRAPEGVPSDRARATPLPQSRPIGEIVEAAQHEERDRVDGRPPTIGRGKADPHDQGVDDRDLEEQPAQALRHQCGEKRQRPVVAAHHTAHLDQAVS